MALYIDKNVYVGDTGVKLGEIANKAPKSHASSANTYGVGTTANYGHNKVINDLTHTAFANGEALAAYQGKILKDLIDTLTTELNKLKETVLWTGSVQINGDNNTTKTLSGMPNLTNYSGKHLKLQLRYTGDMAVVKEFVIGSFKDPIFVSLTRDYSGNNDQWTLLFSITSINSTSWKIKTHLSWQIQNTSLAKINSSNYAWCLEKISVIGV